MRVSIHISWFDPGLQAPRTNCDTGKRYAFYIYNATNYVYYNLVYFLSKSPAACILPSLVVYHRG
jgi:hypothetical protein